MSQKNQTWLSNFQSVTKWKCSNNWTKNCPVTRVARKVTHHRTKLHPNKIFFDKWCRVMELTTPTTEVTLTQCQKPTPVKARIQGAIDFLESESIKRKKSAEKNVMSWVLQVTGPVTWLVAWPRSSHPPIFQISTSNLYRVDQSIYISITH